MINVGIEKCRGCQGTDLVADYGAGDVICQACGLVDGWQLLDERPAFEDQVTNFGAIWGDAASRQKRQKVMASLSCGKQKAGNAANFQALMTGSSGVDDKPRTSKRGLEASEVVRSAGSALQLNACLVDAALKRLTTLDFLGRLPHRAGAVLGCASLYHACKDGGAARTLEELSSCCGLSKVDVGRALAALRKEEEEAEALAAIEAAKALPGPNPLRRRSAAPPKQRAASPTLQPPPPPPPSSSPSPSSSSPWLQASDEFRVDFSRPPMPSPRSPKAAALENSNDTASELMPPPPPQSAPEVVGSAAAVNEALWAAGELSAGDLGLDQDRSGDDDENLKEERAKKSSAALKRPRAEMSMTVKQKQEEEQEQDWLPRDSPTAVADHAAAAAVSSRSNTGSSSSGSSNSSSEEAAAERARALAALVVLPEHLLPRLCDALRLPASFQALAGGVARAVVTSGRLEGRPPQLQAAACLHLCHFLFPRCAVDAAAIAAACNVSTLQLRKVHKVLAPHWPELLPTDTQRKIGADTLNDLLRV